MAKTRRCPIHGVTIPPWAPGTCPECAKTEDDSHHYAGSGTSAQPRALPRSGCALDPESQAREHEASLTGQRPQPTQVDINNRWTNRGRARLDGFNRLLRDVYGTETSISALLSRAGVPQKQLAGWRKDKGWLMMFLDHLEEELVSALDKRPLAGSPHVLVFRYVEGQSATEIAARLTQDVSEVEAALERVLAYLRSERGKVVFEKAVLMCARSVDS